MNILHASVFEDGTGYAKAAIGTALALDSVPEFNVHCANIKLANQTILPPQRIQELMDQRHSSYDVVIQQILPPMMHYVAGAKNIGYAYFETSNIKASNWQFNLNLMDELWVSSQQNKECLEQSGVTKPIKVVPIPHMPVEATPNVDWGIKQRYAFYHIGDWSTRKNTLNLLKAYFNAFNPWDNVVLILKSYVEGMTPDQSRDFILNQIKELKVSLRRQQFPPVIVIPEYLSNETVEALHQQGDCFVSMERGAAWNIPAFEALAHDKPVIVPECGGPLEFMDTTKNGQTMLRTRTEIVEGMVRCPYKSIYTAYETWEDASPAQMALAMKDIFDARDELVVDNSYIRNDFNIENAGFAMKEALNDE